MKQKFPADGDHRDLRRVEREIEKIRWEVERLGLEKIAAQFGPA